MSQCTSFVVWFCTYSTSIPTHMEEKKKNKSVDIIGKIKRDFILFDSIKIMLG